MVETKTGRGVRVIGDGTPFGTRILDLESGEPIDRVISAALWMDRLEPPRLDLTVLLPTVEITAVVTSVSRECPCCGHVREDEPGEVS